MESSYFPSPIDCPIRAWDNDTTRFIDEHGYDLKTFRLNSNFTGELKYFPANCSYIEIVAVKGLRRLPRLPVNLRGITILHCPDLEEIPEIPEFSQLQISIGNCPRLGIDGLIANCRYRNEPFDKTNKAAMYTNIRVTESIRRRNASKITREEICMAVYHPKRVEKFIEKFGIEAIDIM